MAIAQDSKFGSIEHEKFHEDEPIFIIRAADVAAPATLDAYAAEAEAAGSQPSHIAGVMNAQSRIREWQERNAELVKAAD